MSKVESQMSKRLLAALRFPPKVDARMQWLMDRNNDGLLSGEEREELAYLVELSEYASLLSLRGADSLFSEA